MRRILKTLAVFATILALQLTAGPAQAGLPLTAIGPTNPTAAGSAFPANGFPNWIQDSNGITLQGCLDNSGGLAPLCVIPIISEEDYVPTSPTGGSSIIQYCGGLPSPPGIPATLPQLGLNGCPVNYPIETFFSYVATDPKGIAFKDALGAIIPGSNFTSLMVIEGTFFNTVATTPPAPPKFAGGPRPVQGDQILFQRIRVDIGNPPVAGQYSFVHPWGTIDINTPNVKGALNCTPGVLCKMIYNIPFAAGKGLFSPALGTGDLESLGPFMQPADVNGVPLPPIVNALGNQFIGNPRQFSFGILPGCPAAGPATAGCNVIANGTAFVTLSGPGVSATTNQFNIGGQQFGIDVQPRADVFPATIVGTTPLPAANTRTYTITNNNILPVPLPVGAVAPDITIAAAAAAPPGLVISGTNATDFTIPAATDKCSGITLLAVPAGTPPNTCTFTVLFNPLPLTPTEAATRVAQVDITPSAPANFPKGRVSLSGTAQYPAAVSAVGTFGGIAPSGATLAVDAGTAKAYTITPQPKFMVKDITVNGQPATFTKPADPSKPVTFTAPAITAPQTIQATFMPSGNLTGTGTMGVNDAIKALRIFIGLQTPDSTDLAAMDVAPLGPDGRPLGDNTQDLKDVMLILRRVLGAVTW